MPVCVEVLEVLYDAEERFAFSQNGRVPVLCCRELGEYRNEEGQGPVLKKGCSALAREPNSSGGRVSLILNSGCLRLQGLQPQPGKIWPCLKLEFKQTLPEPVWHIGGPELNHQWHLHVGLKERRGG